MKVDQQAADLIISRYPDDPELLYEMMQGHKRGLLSAMRRDESLQVEIHRKLRYSCYLRWSNILRITGMTRKEFFILRRLRGE